MLSKIKVPRSLQSSGKAKSVLLHEFVDASQDAYGAVVYMKIEYDDRRTLVSFVTSKINIAPLQATSIPRLELMGAVIGKRLALSVAETLNVEKQSITFWTDSTTVLEWIRGHSRQFKPFVANQVGEIQADVGPERWRYVTTEKNPADYLTRGTKLVEISEVRAWWEGPTFILKDQCKCDPV